MRRRKYYRTNKRGRKRGRGVPYIYNKRIYLGKNTKRNWGSFSSFRASFTKRRKHYWTLMIKKRYVWFANIKKTKKNKKKYLKKYKTKRGRGFGDGFNLLYSLGKQWRNSMQ